jgi:cytochrome c oxidase cbb3-type subunit 3
MSDFYSGFWDWYIAIITVISVIGCAIFLKSQSKTHVKLLDNGEPESTAHVWDGDLREFQHPLPRWWVVLFYATVVFGVGYLVLFPGLGTQYKGVLKWTSAGELQAENRVADAHFGPIFDAYLKQDLIAVSADPRARQIGQRIFLNTCSMCHGSDARGARGFPNLTDEIWIWGGTPEAIEATITEGREAVMPPQIDAVGTREDALDVASYVLSLSGTPHEEGRSARGQEKFAAICSACHGADAKGNPLMGAANLTVRVKTYGNTQAAVLDAILHGHHGVMPAHKDVLTPAQIHLVAAYVYGLSRPPAAPAAALPIGGALAAR